MDNHDYSKGITLEQSYNKTTKMINVHVNVMYRFECSQMLPTPNYSLKFARYAVPILTFVTSNVSVSTSTTSFVSAKEGTAIKRTLWPAGP